MLLGAGADANIPVTAAAAYKEQVRAALLAGEADAEVHRDGVTALHLAARGGFVRACALLLETGGAAVRHQDAEGDPATVYAMHTEAKANSSEARAVVKYLVEHGADPTALFLDEQV